MGKYVFGVDVGGTTVKLGLFNAEGELFDKWEIPTRTQEGGSHILPNVAESIREKIREKQIAQEDITGVGVGAPVPLTMTALSTERSIWDGKLSALKRRWRRNSMYLSGQEMTLMWQPLGKCGKAAAREAVI